MCVLHQVIVWGQVEKSPIVIVIVSFVKIVITDEHSTSQHDVHLIQNGLNI